jgi:tRNA G18 (ribose-2'-O)-methylase SpoU
METSKVTRILSKIEVVLLDFRSEVSVARQWGGKLRHSCLFIGQYLAQAHLSLSQVYPAVARGFGTIAYTRSRISHVFATPMPFISDISLTDPRLEPYLRLKDRDLVYEGDLFMAEGELVVKRLLASRFSCQSVLISQRLVKDFEPVMRDDLPVFVLPDRQIDQVVGFKFHNGALAVGVRDHWPRLADVVTDAAKQLIVVAPNLNSTENLGAVLRISAGFGASALVIGPESANPFYRQSIRVSMGAAFSVPIVVSGDVGGDLKRLHADFGFDTLASVLREGAIPLNQYTPRSRCAIVLGSEAHGLIDSEILACTHHLTIPMQLGTDSLNVAIACAVFAWHVTNQK